MTTKTDDLVNIFMQEDGDKFWGPKRVYPTAADFVCALFANSQELFGERWEYSLQVFVDFRDVGPKPWEDGFPEELRNQLTKWVKGTHGWAENGWFETRGEDDGEPYWEFDARS